MPLEAKNVSFHYRKGPWIVRDLTLDVNPGEVVGIFGPSGCGKSTFARLLSGYERPVSGTVTVGRRPFKSNEFNPVQWVGQHPEKSVNPRWRMGKILSEGFRPDDGLLGSLGIQKAWMNRWPNELSAGELQRFCLARALSPMTRYLIADEITTMLDPVTQAQIWDVLLKMAKTRKLGLLAISHDRALLDRICERILPFKKIGCFS